MKRMLDEMNTLEVQTAIASKRPLFFPVGTLEAHGRHLPTGTDTFCALDIAAKLAEAFEGVVAPPFSYGLTNLFAQTAPASFYDEKLYERFLFETVNVFVRHGFETVIIVNGHGGNMPPLKNIARKLSRTEPVKLSVLNWWIICNDAVEKVYQTRGGHAAVEETAAILHFRPELVVEDNYKPETDAFVPDDGLWCYPAPGEVLQYSGVDGGRPDFSKEKADEFMRLVIDSIVARLKKWLEGTTRINSGLRPW